MPRGEDTSRHPNRQVSLYPAVGRREMRPVYDENPETGMTYYKTIKGKDIYRHKDGGFYYKKKD